MSDRYVHLFPFAGRWDQRQGNLVTLGRHLAVNARAIRAAGGLVFGHEDMAGVRPPPGAVAAASGERLPALAHGPQAGLPAVPGEDWPAYVHRVFGIHDHRPSMAWLQSAMWQKTEPSPEGAALRIAYLLDYGVPHDYVEIAMGQAYTDYDSNGFLWEKLGVLPDHEPDDDEQGGLRQRRAWPAWIGAVEQERRRSAIRRDYLIPAVEAPFAGGWGADNIAALSRRVGPLPDSYNDFLLLSGRRDDGNGPYGDQLEHIDRQARQRIFDAERPEDDPVPMDAIFIGLEDGGHPQFILGGKRPDSPVFRFDADTGRVTQLGISVFTWIEAFMRNAGPLGPVGQAAPKAAPTPRPERDKDARSLLDRIRHWFG